MKDKQSSIDFYAFVKLYSERFSGAFIKKIYQTGKDEFTFIIYSSEHGKYPFHIKLSAGIAFMDPDRPEESSSFAMFLRKNLSEQKIRSIEQVNFDRVCKISLYSGMEIVFELFRDGNLIILENGLITYAFSPREWKNRKILKGEHYIPPSLQDPLSSDLSTLKSIFEHSKGSLVQTMATRMNLGGEYAEEVAFRLGIDKDQPSKESLDLVPAVISEINKLLEETSLNKGFYYDSDNMVSPVRLTSINEAPRIFEDFNEGLAFQMGKLREVDPQISQIERRMANQTKTVQQYIELSGNLKELGQIIISNLPEFEKILSIVNANYKTLSKGGIIMPGISILDIDFSRKLLTIKKDDKEIQLSLNRTAGENASDYFNKSKDYILKAEGAKKAIMETSKVKLEENVRKKKDRPKKWFESYHWFITSSGNLVVAGKDISGNEKVVKKHMSEKDIYIHADLYGAPSTVLKIEKENTDMEKDILEAAQFAVSNSRAWSNNLASGSAYWVTPLQVSKTPESGEFVRKGSWIVKGKRNYLFNLPLKLKISTVLFENTELPMICPHITEIKNEKDLIFLSPGETKREKIAKEISEILGRERDEIASILPPGGSRIDSITKKAPASISQ